MRKGLTEVIFILDRSGSMRGLEADTIGGFNSMIEKQRKEDELAAKQTTTVSIDTTEKKEIEFWKYVEADKRPPLVLPNM